MVRSLDPGPANPQITGERANRSQLQCPGLIGVLGTRLTRRTLRAAVAAAAVPASRRRAKMDLLRIILAILLPPLGVFLQVGLGLHFWLNILLTILGYIPGIVHAVWIIARR